MRLPALARKAVRLERRQPLALAVRLRQASARPNIAEGMAAASPARLAVRAAAGRLDQMAMAQQAAERQAQALARPVAADRMADRLVPTVLAATLVRLAATAVAGLVAAQAEAALMLQARRAQAAAAAAVVVREPQVALAAWSQSGRRRATARWPVQAVAVERAAVARAVRLVPQGQAAGTAAAALAAASALPARPALLARKGSSSSHTRP